MSAVNNEVLDYWLAAQRDWITFDVLTLAEQLLATGSSPPVARDLLRKLSPCAVVARYQGSPIIDVGRDELVAIVAQARQWAEQLRTDYFLP